MKKRKVLIMGTLGVLLACGYLVASAPSKGRRNRTVAPQVPIRLARGAGTPQPEAVARFQGLDDPARRYTIVPAPVRAEVKARTAQEDDLFEQATAIMLRARPVPAERLRFFSWVDEGDYPFKLYGWSAFVYKVNPLPGGWAITLKVWPKVTSNAQIATSYYEEYVWSDGVLDFVQGYGNPKTPGINILW